MPQPINVPMLVDENTLDLLGQNVAIGDAVLAATLSGSLTPGIVLGYRQYRYLVQCDGAYHTSLYTPCDLVKYTNVPQDLYDRMYNKSHEKFDFTPSDEGKYSKKYVVVQGFPRNYTSYREGDVFIVQLHGNTADDFQYMMEYLAKTYDVNTEVNILFSSQAGAAKWDRYIQHWPPNGSWRTQDQYVLNYHRPTLAKRLLSKKIITGLGMDDYVNTRMSVDEFNLLIADAPLGDVAQIEDTDHVK